MTKKEKLNIIKQQAHCKFDSDQYDKTLVRNLTNSYSHILGLTEPFIEFYRIGAISEKKDITEDYMSLDEMKELLLQDLEALRLNYEELDFETDGKDVNLKNNQYIVKVYAVVYANNKIFDYQCMRYEDGNWTEKRRGMYMLKHDKYSIGKYDMGWQYTPVVCLKITR